MLIGELAREAGLTPATIRFYEKKGLVDTRHRARLGNNYKDYGPAALERLQFIAQAKSAGFTLREVEQFLLNWDNLGPAERRRILLDKISQIDRRMAELAKMRTHLTAKAARYADAGH